VAGYRLEAQRQAKLIAQLEKEREKYGQDANEAGNRYVQVGGGGGRGAAAQPQPHCNLGSATSPACPAA
jgi:hypothetical protein